MQHMWLCRLPSAGTTNAIIDAKVLAANLAATADIEKGIYSIIIWHGPKSLVRHVTLGRELKNSFLHPQSLNDDHIPVPLIALDNNDRPLQKSKAIQVQCFTRPHLLNLLGAAAITQKAGTGIWQVSEH
jgi:hypothetical protein